MTTATLKQELHQYIDNGDERFLQMVHTMAKEYTDAETDDFAKEEMLELDARMQSYLNGESKSYTWEEAKAIITGRKK